MAGTARLAPDEPTARPGITVIIATSCEPHRVGPLRRAIASVLSQDGVDVDLVVVVNGTRVDAGFYDELRSDGRLRVCYRDEGSFPAAVRFGREQVRREYFSFLDDDDYYLPGALRTRLEALIGPPVVDFVCTNGYVEGGHGDALFVRDTSLLATDPLGAHFAFNWLGSSAALFRAETITPEYFDGVTRHFEWTWLTHRLLTAGKTVRFADVPTFYKCDTPGSLSKDPSADPLLTEVRLLQSMQIGARPVHRRVLSHKIRAALHALSHHHASIGRLDQAWSCHLRSLVRHGGWRHLPYTRHLLLATVTRLWRSSPR